MTDFRKCVKCGSSSTYIYNGRPKWHNSDDGTLCHTCYSARYRASDNGGDLIGMVEDKKPLMEIKCANPTCSNRIYVAGSPKMDVDKIEVGCGDCKLVSTYTKKKEKATEVKRIIDGQLRLDPSLDKDDE